MSVHVRLKPSTRGVITAEDLGTMRPDALFVNTSRAGLVESDALVEALDRGRPGYAALDVFDEEPITNATDPLVNRSNVVSTPHIGFVTEDELDRQFSDVYGQILAFAAGTPINVVNDRVLS